MGANTGIVAMGDYAGAATDNAAIQLLIDMIPNVDTTSTSGAQAGNGHAQSALDLMNPVAAAQLRVELLALQDAINTTNTL